MMGTCKKAILAVSFGTSHTEAIESCIRPAEEAIGRAADGYELFRAFTSGMIIHKLKMTKELLIQTPSEALCALAEDGYTEIAVQPTHILAGIEYHELAQEVRQFARAHPQMIVRLGEPLLFTNADYAPAAQALGRWLPRTCPDEAVVLMGHGTEHISNSAYFQLQYYLDRLPARTYYVQRAGGQTQPSVYVANVEAPPVLDDAIAALKEEKVKKVYLLPFMLVAGEHAHHDMAGENADSFASRLKAAGFTVEAVMHGLGESTDICRLYARKAHRLVQAQIA